MDQRSSLDKSLEDLSLKFEKISIDYYGVNQSDIKYETILSGLELIGSSACSSLDSEIKIELGQSIKFLADELLSVHYNMSKNLLEDEIFNKLQIKYGGYSWWQSAKFTRLIIDDLDLKPRESISTTKNPSSEKKEIIYVVKKEDTFWNIIEKQFNEDIKDLPAGKRMEVLDRLFDTIEGTSELRATLNLRSGDDIDLIYPGEEINLSAVSLELGKILGVEIVSDSFKKSASLRVEENEAVKDIPIKFTSSKEEEVKPLIKKLETAIIKTQKNSSIVTDSGPKIGIKSVFKKEVEPITPPRFFKPDGNYFDQPDYKLFVSKVFGNEKAFAKILNRAIENLDNSTYDLFNKGIYNSPFNLLKDMSLSEIQKFQNLPNARVREIMKTENIKYDTYLAWLDLIDEMTTMKEHLPQEGTTTLIDLFSRYVAESEAVRLNKFKDK